MTDRILLICGRKIDAELVTAIRTAAYTDIEYMTEIVLTHMELTPKVGYRPIRISGVSIPSFMMPTFVVGRDNKEEYIYVVNRFLNTEYLVSSEEQARHSILSELKRILTEQLL